MELKSLSISLMYSNGPMMKVRLRLAIQLAGALFAAGARAAGAVAERGRDLRDLDLGGEDFRELCRRAQAAGIPERLPRVRAVVDTSDHSASLLLQFAHEKGSQTLELHLLSSGFEGEDAEALRQFFAALLKAAGVEDRSAWFDLAGRP